MGGLHILCSEYGKHGATPYTSTKSDAVGQMSLKLHTTPQSVVVDHLVLETISGNGPVPDRSNHPRSETLEILLRVSLHLGIFSMRPLGSNRLTRHIGATCGRRISGLRSSGLRSSVPPIVPYKPRSVSLLESRRLVH